MINKKTLMLIGGGIAAYYIWKNYIKEDVVATAPVEGETSNFGGGKNKFIKGTTGKGGQVYCHCDCKDGREDVKISCPKPCNCKERCNTACS